MVENSPDFLEAVRVSLYEDSRPIILHLQEQGVGSSFTIIGTTFNENAIFLQI